MESSSAKERGLDNQEDAVSSTADSLPLTDASSSKTDKDGRPPGDDALKPGSLTLGREKREIYISPQSKGFTLPRTIVDRSPTSATAPSVKPLPKALQPKTPRDSSQPLSPIQKANTGYSPLATAVNVTDSVLRQQRRHSSTEFATSPTAVSPSSRLSSPLHAKPEVVSERPEAGKDSSVGDRHEAREPSFGLAKFPAGQRPLFITEATKPRRPKPEVSSENRHRPKSTSFSDVLSFFESPSSTTPRMKPSYTPTSLMYSKLKMFTIDAGERSNIVKGEEPVDSAASNAAVDPSPTISRLMKQLENQNPSVGTGQRLLQTQSSCPDPIPVTSRPAIQIRKSVASPSIREENSDSVSTTSSMSNPIELSPNSADNYSLSPNTEFGVGLQQKMSSDTHHDGTKLPVCEVKVWTKTAEEPAEKDAEENEDEVTAAGTNDVLTSDDEAPPPPLPFFPPPLDFEAEERTTDSTPVPRAFHHPSSSDVTEDSGLGCLTPRDYSSADELEDQQLRYDGPQGPLSSSPPTTMSSCSVVAPTSCPLVQPTSVDYNSEFDDGQAAQYSQCRKNTVYENDDVIGSCVAENSDASVCEVHVIKGALGLGFCIEGGKGSVVGDRPITVKRLFRGNPATVGELLVGDEILTVNGEDFTQISHYDAWNRLKAIPHGTLIITIKRC